MAIIIFEFFPRHAAAWRRTVRLANCLVLIPLLSPGTASAAFPNFGYSPKDRAQGDATYQQAYAAYQSGDYPLAQHLAEEADKLKPDQADGWNLRGVVLLKQRSYDQADAAFAHALACDPALWAAQFNLAEVPYQKKDFARARARFEHLLAQTDRYKDTRKWEMVLYKTFLSYLFSGDEAGAKKKLAKISAAPGASPVLVYADAAIAFQRKDAAGAQKIISVAQTKFPQETNDLFSEPLVQAGWINVLPIGPAFAGAPGPLTRGGAAALGASSMGGAVATPGGVYNNHQPIAIDPKLEDAAAEPLPEPDGGVKPVLTKAALTRTVAAAPAATPAPPKARPAATPSVAVTTPPPEPLPDRSLEHAGLLLE